MIRRQSTKTLIILAGLCGLAAVAIALAVAASQGMTVDRPLGLIVSASIVFSVLYVRLTDLVIRWLLMGYQLRRQLKDLRSAAESLQRAAGVGRRTMSNGNDEMEKIKKEIEEIVEEMDKLSDQVGVGFWDGWDIVVWLLGAVLFVIGLFLPGHGWVVSVIAAILVILDIIAKIGAFADDEAEKKKADEIERRLRELERRLRELK